MLYKWPIWRTLVARANKRLNERTARDALMDACAVMSLMYLLLTHLLVGCGEVPIRVVQVPPHVACCVVGVELCVRVDSWIAPDEVYMQPAMVVEVELWKVRRVLLLESLALNTRSECPDSRIPTQWMVEINQYY